MKYDFAAPLNSANAVKQKITGFQSYIYLYFDLIRFFLFRLVTALTQKGKKYK